MSQRRAKELLLCRGWPGAPHEMQDFLYVFSILHLVGIGSRDDTPTGMLGVA